MVRLRGAAFSLDASGTIADTVSVGSWKGRTYMRKKPKPQHPDTPVQIGYRQLFKWLTQNWSRISAAHKLTWAPLAEETNTTPFDAYLAFNIQAARTELAPADSYPPTRSGTGWNWESPYPIAVAAENAVHIQIKATMNIEHNGCYLYRALGTWPGSKLEDVVHIFAIDATDISQHYDRGLAPGEWWYRFRLFNLRGNRRGISSLRKVTIT